MKLLRKTIAIITAAVLVGAGVTAAAAKQPESAIVQSTGENVWSFNRETGETVDYAKPNPIKIKGKIGVFAAKALKSKARAVRLFEISNSDTDQIKVSVVKKKTSKALRNKVKSVNVKSGKVALNKGIYKKGTYKLTLKFSAPAFLGYKSAVIVKTFKIKIA